MTSFNLLRISLSLLNSVAFVFVVDDVDGMNREMKYLRDGNNALLEIWLRYASVASLTSNCKGNFGIVPRVPLADTAKFWNCLDIFRGLV